jgi:hypothetical protein
MTDTAEIFSRIESAAQDGAFGQNRRPTPTDAQCSAGNYKVGRVQAFGLNLAIEQPRNTYRTGIGKDGKRWTTRLAAHYGYIPGTKGADGDAVDCFIGFYPQSEYAWVINQYVDGQWDEHKVMLAFPDDISAQRAYLDSYEKGWNGLHSIVKASLTQLKWWLKNGNLTKPLRPEYLPYEGLETMTQRVIWDSAQNPSNMTLDKVLYEIRRADAGENLVLDAVCMADILEDADEILVFDALVSTYAGLERKMQALLNVMTRAGDTVKPMALQISEPFKQSGVAQVAVVFELSDGQTVSIFFHNPDVTPQKMAPGDSLVSWKLLLNKKDVTIVVAPERGLDLNVREVATRIMKLAEKNSAAFARANAKRAENVAAIESLKTEITALETELADAQHELEVAKQEYEDRLANAPEQPEPESAGAQTEQKSSAEQETEEQKAEERQARAIETLRNIANDPAEYAIKQRSLSELEAATLVINKDYKGALGALSATPSKERIYLVSEFRRLINESQLLESLPALAVSALSAIMASDYVPAKKRLELLIQSQPIEQKQDQTPPILQALIDIGWQNISVDGLIPAKNIGGGTKTATNPDGTRRVSAKIENGELQATFAGKVLASAPMNAGLSPAENAKNLDDAVNAIDPNFTSAKEARETDEIELTGKELGDFPDTPEGYAKIMADPELQLQYQDVLDPFFQSRIDVVRKDLRDVDWESNESGELSKNGFLAKFNFKHADSEAKVIGYWVSIMDGADIQAEIGDTLTGTAADVAAQIDAVVTNSGTVTAKNYADQNTPQGPASNELDLSEDDLYFREDDLSASGNALIKFKQEHQFQTAIDAEEGEYNIDNDPLADFADTAFLVDRAVSEYGGSVVWGNFDASAYGQSVFDSAAIKTEWQSISLDSAINLINKNLKPGLGVEVRYIDDNYFLKCLNNFRGKVFDSESDVKDFLLDAIETDYKGNSCAWLFADCETSWSSGIALDSVVSPGSIVGQIANKDGAIVARVRIEENGMMTLFKGETGLEQVADPTAVVAKIEAVVAATFGGVENKVRVEAPHEIDARLLNEAEAFGKNSDNADNFVGAENDYEQLKNGLMEAKPYAWGFVVGHGTIQPVWSKGDGEIQSEMAKPDIAEAYAGMMATDFWGNRKIAEPAADQELMNKIFAGYGYPGGADMPEGLSKTATKLYQAIIGRDVDTLVPILHPENKLSRKAFEHLFDGKLKLPRTIKGVLQVVEDFFGKINDKMESEAVQETETVTPGPKEDEPATQDEPVPVPENSEQAVAQEVAPEGSEVQAEAVKSSFIAELSELQSETDIEAFDRKLDDIAGRIEAAGLMDELDAELNAAADRLTELLAEAEKAVV